MTERNNSPDAMRDAPDWDERSPTGRSASKTERRFMPEAAKSPRQTREDEPHSQSREVKDAVDAPGRQAPEPRMAQHHHPGNHGGTLEFANASDKDQSRREGVSRIQAQGWEGGRSSKQQADLIRRGENLEFTKNDGFWHPQVQNLLLDMGKSSGLASASDRNLRSPTSSQERSGLKSGARVPEQSAAMNDPITPASQSSNPSTQPEAGGWTPDSRGGKLKGRPSEPSESQTEMLTSTSRDTELSHSENSGEMGADQPGMSTMEKSVSRDEASKFFNGRDI